VIPLKDDNPTRRFPFITLVIIALNVLAFVLWEPVFASGPRGDLEQETFFFCHAEIPYEVTHQTSLAEGGPDAGRQIDEQDLGVRGSDLQQFLAEKCPHKNWLLSIFVAMFLHGSWLHIGFNMLFFWVFGNNVEDKLGPFVYLLFYLAAGVAASFTQLAVSVNSVIPNLGASGAIAGVLGAYLVMFPRRRVLTLVIFFFVTFVYLPAYLVLGIWFVLQLFSGVGSLTSRVNAGGGVAFWAHIGGFAFGTLLALLFFPKEGFRSRPTPPRPDFLGGRGWGRRGVGGPGVP
jgi:membrane associated rhomboid family serine protease